MSTDVLEWSSITPFTLKMFVYYITATDYAMITITMNTTILLRGFLTNFHACVYRVKGLVRPVWLYASRAGGGPVLYNRKCKMARITDALNNTGFVNAYGESLALPCRYPLYRC
jgi:hypothetical protein